MNSFLSKFKKIIQRDTHSYDDYIDDYTPPSTDYPSSPEAEYTVTHYDNEAEPEHASHIQETTDNPSAAAETVSETELPVDVFQHAEEIVIRAFVPGVLPSRLDITLSRDMVSIAGERLEERETDAQEDYFYQELPWGPFSRTILLPEEIDVETSTANESHGVLTIRMPKINKAKKTKLKVRAGR